MKSLASILVLYLLLALGYGVVNPLFEAPDEHNHYFTVQTIVETRALPSVGPEPDPWMGQEAAQPPLTYLLGALLVAPIKTGGARDRVWPNPFTQLGDASSPTNINAFVHGPVEAWPWQGYVLAAHLLRAMSAVFGLGTLLCIYASGRLLWPSRPQPALLATALVAFLPQFGFLHGAISNDPPIVFLCTAALWQLLRLWLVPVRRVRLLGLGITIGLAILTKTTGLLLLVYAAGLLFLLALRDGRRRLLWETVALVIAPALLISGWLLWRNWTLYGDVTAANQFVQFFGGSREYTLWQVLAESKGIWTSLFAVLGWFNVRAPRWVYLVWDGLALLALLGAVWTSYRMRAISFRHLVSAPCLRGKNIRFRFDKGNHGDTDPGTDRHTCPGGQCQGDKWDTEKKEKPLCFPCLRGKKPGCLLQRPWMPAVLLCGWLLLVYAGLAQFMMRTPAAQGRLLFPALSPMALGLAWGLDCYRRASLRWLAVALTLATSLYCLLFVIPAAYARPPVVARPPTDAVLLDVDMGHGVTLVAADVETELARPGEWVWLTLYWQARAVPEQAPELVLVLFGREVELVGKLQSYHGGGLYPANLWFEGELIADRIAVRLSPETQIPTQVRLNLSLVNGTGALDVGTLKVVPAVWPAPSEVILARLGDGVDLAAASLTPTTVRAGESVSLAVRWQVRTAPGADLTTFVHLGDSSRPPLAGADSPPLGGDYPTHLWKAGEVIDDSYLLTLPLELPPGRYPLWLGMYDRETMIRQPLWVEEARQPNDAYLAGWLTVEE